MQEHVRLYPRARLMREMLIYGPVMATRELWSGGAGRWRRGRVQEFGDEDPSIKAGMNLLSLSDAGGSGGADGFEFLAQTDRLWNSCAELFTGGAD